MNDKTTVTSLRESCGWCGACGSLEFVADEPKGATAFAHLQWIAVKCNACGRTGEPFPVDKNRPNGKHRFFSLHKYRVVGELGVFHYEECTVCGDRRNTRRFIGGYSPVAWQWLYGAPWAFEPDRTVPPRSPAASYNKRSAT